MTKRFSALAIVLLVGCSDDKGSKSADGSASLTDGAAGTSDAGTAGDGPAKDGGTSDAAATDAAATDAAATGAGDAPVGDVGAAAVLAPPAAGAGVQVTMASVLDPGLETERCAFYRAPAEGLNIVREEIKYSPGSHHAVLWMTSYTEIPVMDKNGTAVNTSKVFDCGKGVFGVWDVTGLVAVHQVADGPATVNGLPEGVALKVPGNALLLINTHYLNASANTLNAQLTINLHTIKTADVKTEAGILFLYNPMIRVPAHGTATARMQCPAATDINVLNAQSHMHARGVDYVANRVTKDGKADLLFAGKDWSEVSARTLAPPMVVKAGEVFDFKCSYNNVTNKDTKDQVVTQGFTTKDEMCVFWGLYYPRDKKTEYCSFTQDFSGVAFGGNWVGDGDNTHDGTATAVCLGAAAMAGTRAGIYGCVVDACPKISVDVSAAARCLTTHGISTGQCIAECTGADKSGCDACTATQCTPLIKGLVGKACQ